MSDTKRPGIHAYLSEPAYEALHWFASENGVSVTSLIEQLGLDLAEEMERAGSSEVRQDMVRRCRKTDAERRRR